MTSKKAIKKMMAVGIPRDTARLWSDIGTALRLTNEAVAMMAIHCEGKRPAEIYTAEIIGEQDGIRIAGSGRMDARRM